MNETEETSEAKAPDIEGYRESCKLFFDFFKHLTTLSTGSLVLITTFLTKIAREGGLGDSVGNAVICLLVSIGASVLAMFVFAGHISGRKDQQEVNRSLIALAAVVAGGAFVAGLSQLYEVVKIML